MDDNDKAAKPSGLRRKASLNVTFCVKKEKNVQYKKIYAILQKSESERSLEEKTALENSASIVKEVNLRLEKRRRLKSRSEEIEDEPAVLAEKCYALANAISKSRHLVIYSGAGVSTAACIPDYRGTNGIWTRLQQGKDIGSHDLSRAEPTLTHMALYALHISGKLKHIVSQNCDGLHLRSGIPRTVLSEVHGNMYLEVCIPCKLEYWRLFDVTQHTARYCHETARLCFLCRKPLRDTIVHFGERGALKWPLNWTGACDNADKADLILCIGSSLKVLKRYPWLWSMDKPVKRRPLLYIVNLQWTPKDDHATLKINGRCDQVMSLVMEHLGVLIPTYIRHLDPIFAHATILHEVELHTTSQPILQKYLVDVDKTDDEKKACDNLTNCDSKSHDKIEEVSGENVCKQEILDSDVTDNKSNIVTDDFEKLENDCKEEKRSVTSNEGSNIMIDEEYDVEKDYDGNGSNVIIDRIVEVKSEDMSVDDIENEEVAMIEEVILDESMVAINDELEITTEEVAMDETETIIIISNDDENTDRVVDFDKSDNHVDVIIGNGNSNTLNDNISDAVTSSCDNIVGTPEILLVKDSDPLWRPFCLSDGISSSNKNSNSITENNYNVGQNSENNVGYNKNCRRNSDDNINKGCNSETIIESVNSTGFTVPLEKFDKMYCKIGKELVKTNRNGDFLKEFNHGIGVNRCNKNLNNFINTNNNSNRIINNSTNISQGNLTLIDNSLSSTLNSSSFVLMTSAAGVANLQNSANLIIINDLNNINNYSNAVGNTFLLSSPFGNVSNTAGIFPVNYCSSSSLGGTNSNVINNNKNILNNIVYDGNLKSNDVLEMKPLDLSKPLVGNKTDKNVGNCKFCNFCYKIYGRKVCQFYKKLIPKIPEIGPFCYCCCDEDDSEEDDYENRTSKDDKNNKTNDNNSNNKNENNNSNKNKTSTASSNSATASSAELSSATNSKTCPTSDTNNVKPVPVINPGWFGKGYRKRINRRKK